MAAITIRGAELVGADGLHFDNWCGPLVSLRLQTKWPSSIGSCQVWMKQEPHLPKACRFAAQIDDESPFVCNVDVESPTVILFSCNRLAHQVVTLRLLCNHVIREQGEDKRSLSFVLSELSFQ